MQPHRSNALRYASAARDAHSRVYGGCAAEAAVSEASGPRVSGCIYALGYLVNPPSAWPGFSRPLSTPVHEHLHKCRGGIAQAWDATPSLTPRLGWVAC